MIVLKKINRFFNAWEVLDLWITFIFYELFLVSLKSTSKFLLLLNFQVKYKFEKNLYLFIRHKVLSNIYEFSLFFLKNICILQHFLAWVRMKQISASFSISKSKINQNSKPSSLLYFLISMVLCVYFFYMQLVILAF